QAVADADRVALDRHLAGKAAVHGIEAQEMRIGLDRGEIVDADDLDIGAPRFGDGTQHVAADAAEPVDADTNCHSRLLRSRRGRFPASAGTAGASHTKSQIK